MDTPQILAYYLPQFHSFPENDLWWGKGFTEWTNVRKARPLFPGHRQPRIPTELGYYDLRNPEIRQRQADLARLAGVTAFCYWHYWFNGKQLMNTIIDDVVRLNEPQFPFCMAWANESWYKKMWGKDSSEDKLLIEQTYGDDSECRAHYLYMRTLFESSLYYRVEGRPFFMVYKPSDLPNIEGFINNWNKWIREDGIADSIYFVADINYTEDYHKHISQGFDAVTAPLRARVLYTHYNLRRGHNRIADLRRKFLHWPYSIRMKNINRNILDTTFDLAENVIPNLYPQWDHTPRSGASGIVVTGATPSQFKEQAAKILSFVNQKKNKIVMLKSWNEWAEGNYMEPDSLYGRGFIEALASVMSNYCNKNSETQVNSMEEKQISPHI